MEEKIKIESIVLNDNRKKIMKELEEKRKTQEEVINMLKILTKESKGGYNQEKENVEKIYQILNKEIESYEEALKNPYFGRVDFTERLGDHEEIYIGKKGISSTSDGDEIVVPNDGTNETRALLLLQDNGIITLPEGTDASSLVTKLDIVSKSVDVEIVEVEAATVSRYRDQAALVVLNGNYALAAGLSVAKDSIAYESASSSAAVTYVNVVATTEKGKDNEGVKALVEVLESQEIKDFINEKWDGSVVPFTE